MEETTNNSFLERATSDDLKELSKAIKLQEDIYEEECLKDMRKKNPQLFVPKVLHNKCDLDEFEKIFFNYWNIIPMEVYELDN